VFRQSFTTSKLVKRSTLVLPLKMLLNLNKSRPGTIHQWVIPGLYPASYTTMSPVSLTIGIVAVEPVISHRDR
jgi:hypothetical protein